MPSSRVYDWPPVVFRGGGSDLTTVTRQDDPYASAAVGHYLSPGRTDYVKALWERPQMIALLRDALGFIRPEPAVPGPLRVVDLGAGAGEGYDLIMAAGLPAGSLLEYVAVDRSRAMLGLLSRHLA